MSEPLSYAAVAAKDAPPPSEQPHPDPALLTTEPPSHDNIADDIAKVNVVSSDFKEHPATTTSIQDIPADNLPPLSPPSHKHPEGPTGRARRYTHKAEDEGFYLINLAKHYILRPSVAGGLLGVVNVGLLSWAGYNLYAKPELRQDTRLLATGAAATLTIFGAEGYAAEQYRKTPRGQEEERKAKQEGAQLYKHARQVVLRPGVLDGLVGLLNVSVLGGVGFAMYHNWNAPRWDRRVVSAVTVGLVTLFSGEGLLAEQYQKQRK